MTDGAKFQTGSSRRHFLRTMCSGAGVGIAAHAGVHFSLPSNLHGQIDLSPDSAVQELVIGNQRFSSNRLTSIEHDLTILKDRTVEKQEPFAAVLSCAD